MEGDTTGREIVLADAADTSADRTLRDPMAEHHAAGDLVAPDQDGVASALDCGKMARVSGWTPRFRWRNLGA